MPLNDIGRFHVSKILVADMTVADTLIGAVEAKTKEKYTQALFRFNTESTLVWGGIK